MQKQLIKNNKADNRSHLTHTLYFQLHVCTVNNSMQFVEVIIHHNSFFRGELDRRYRRGSLKAAEMMVGKAMAACAGGLIAPLTLQTENLIKCDTED